MAKLRVEDLCRDKRFAYVLVFKNHGYGAGASLKHSHSQIIATPIVPKRVIEELQGAQAHWRLKRRSIFVDIIDQELLMQERLVYENDQMLAFCPFASTGRLRYTSTQNAIARISGARALRNCADCRRRSKPA